MKNQIDKILLTSFALNELEGSDLERYSAHVSQDLSARKTIEDIQKISRLMEGALRMENEGDQPHSENGLRKKRWFAIVPAAAAAGFLMIFGLPYLHHKDKGYSIRVEADAYAATFSPGTDREAIRRVVQEHLFELKKCYEDEMRAQPSLAGKILVRFSFAGDGLVSEASTVRSTLNSPEMENCIVARIKSWQFPNAAHGVTAVVEYPFVFDSK